MQIVSDNIKYLPYVVILARLQSIDPAATVTMPNQPQNPNFVYTVTVTSDVLTQQQVDSFMDEAIGSDPLDLQGYQMALQQFLDQTAQARGYSSEQDCLNGVNSGDANWQADAATMQNYDLYCHQTLNGIFGYAGNTRLPGKRQLNPVPPPGIDEFLNSTLDSISW